MSGRFFIFSAAKASKRARARPSRGGQLPEPEMRSEGLRESLWFVLNPNHAVTIYITYVQSPLPSNRIGDRDVCVEPLEIEFPNNLIFFVSSLTFSRGL